MTATHRRSCRAGGGGPINPTYALDWAQLLWAVRVSSITGCNCGINSWAGEELHLPVPGPGSLPATLQRPLPGCSWVLQCRRGGCGAKSESQAPSGKGAYCQRALHLENTRSLSRTQLQHCRHLREAFPQPMLPPHIAWGRCGQLGPFLPVGLRRGCGQLLPELGKASWKREGQGLGTRCVCHGSCDPQASTGPVSTVKKDRCLAIGPVGTHQGATLCPLPFH